MTDIQPPSPSGSAPVYQQQPAANVPAYQPPVPSAPAKERNILGIVALVLAAVGFIFACIPGALIVGWILLPIAFILGIVAVCLRDKVKWQGVAAIIVSVVGTIVAVAVFFAVVATSFNNAFNNDVEVSDAPAVVEPADETDEEPAEEPAAEVGTRENPAALGATIEGDDWTVVINSVNLDATDAVLAENDFNDEPDAGTVYIGINYTATYTGDDADGQMPAFVSIEYVTGAGVTVNGLDKILVGPDEMDTMSTIYNGASVTGNDYIQVPTPVDGVIAVGAGMLADTVFVSTK